MEQLSIAEYIISFNHNCLYIYIYLGTIPHIFFIFIHWLPSKKYLFAADRKFREGIFPTEHVQQIVPKKRKFPSSPLLLSFN